MIERITRSNEEVKLILSRSDELSQLTWLSNALAMVDYWVLTDEELLNGLTGIVSRVDGKELINQVERRLGTWSNDIQDQAAQNLLDLHQRYGGPGKDAQKVDRVLYRLLHVFKGDYGYELAISCTVSNRLTRKRAAWRYFKANGVGEEAAKLLARDFKQVNDPAYLYLVATSTVLIATVSIEQLLLRIDDFYLRGRAIMTQCPDNYQQVIELARKYPAEVVYAMRRTDMNRVDDIRQILFAAKNDPLVVIQAMYAFSHLKAKPQLVEAKDLGTALLGSSKVWKLMSPSTG